MNSRNQETNKKLLKKLVKRSIQEQAKYKKRQFIQRLLGVVASILVVFSLWLLAASFIPDTSTANCIELQEQATDATVYKFNPRKITVQPWLGEHHVYALFAVPKKYGNAYYASYSDVLVTVKGVTQPITATKANPSLYERVDVSEDSSLMVAYLWTRETIWQILQGKYGELTNPCNWTLYIK
ncbi:hypothetical protein H6F42_15275 [Pseudanabaena sp. FACHB-1998]|uniref:hypothetical protein n=1 Tax=Pseudanabaena sp. FACHB-1998 TaxID=2692858 RepID=UPI0016805A81|nr:hypothetical protein [Pseudanabaena sp. FACHB-1998]MBD2178278.1 hypothetical protein [Pseudanabaena sp. FACHB-1998]